MAHGPKMQYCSTRANVGLGSVRHSHASEECLQKGTKLAISCFKIAVDEVVDRLSVVGCCYL